MALGLLALAALPVAAATPAGLLAGYTAAAGGNAARSGAWPAVLHQHPRARVELARHATAPCPRARGKHASTGKPITPLAPAFNAQRFTDEAKTEKWFRRNCNDVVGRECTAAEKADVLAWLMTSSHERAQSAPFRRTP
jgi:hypothetical protein